jgi:O-antigen ligase
MLAAAAHRRAEHDADTRPSDMTQNTAAATSPLPASPKLESWLVFCAGVALLGSAFLLDPAADAAFDAPKRLIAMIAAVAGGVGMVWYGSALRAGAWSSTAKLIAAAALMALLGVLIATVLSKAPNAWATLRTMALFGLFALLGAAPALGGERRVKVLRFAALAVGVNALISLLQFWGVKFPIPIAMVGGRFPTGALLGNEGYVAIACAIAAAAMLPILLQPGFNRKRLPALGLLLLCVAVIGVNRQLTSAIALIVAAIVAIAVRLRMQPVIWIGAGLLLCVLVSALVPTLREASWGRLPLDAEAYQERSTYRMGAWAAALEMVRARPLTGHGPGSYALGSQEYRQIAEFRYRARLTPPNTAAAFIVSHQDYLQLAAEAGIPVLLLTLTALTGLIIGLLRLARDGDHLEANILLAMISAGAIAALAWFPMQIPLTAILLLLACGRAWRLVADGGKAPAR